MTTETTNRYSKCIEIHNAFILINNYESAKPSALLTIAFKYSKTYSLWISSDEIVDLMNMLGDFIEGNK